MKIVKSLTNASFSFSLSLSVYPIHFLHQRGATSGNKYRLADKLRTMPELEERGKHSETLDSGRFFDLVINLRQTIGTCTSLKFCQAIYRVSRFRPNCFFLFSFYFFRFFLFFFFTASYCAECQAILYPRCFGILLEYRSESRFLDGDDVQRDLFFLSPFHVVSTVNNAVPRKSRARKQHVYIYIYIYTYNGDGQKRDFSLQILSS